ncbi:MAG TPA: hypothetical protein VMF89_02400 [Polyangiales bacterium]|nr:hypothetical protein [Polyangiales bacterium]
MPEPLPEQVSQPALTQHAARTHSSAWSSDAVDPERGYPTSGKAALLRPLR